MDWAKPEVLLTVGASFVGFIVWLVRLEGKVAATNKEVEAVGKANYETHKSVEVIRARQEAIDAKVAIELKEINVKLAQIEGFLMRTTKTTRAIK